MKGEELFYVDNGNDSNRNNIYVRLIRSTMEDVSKRFLCPLYHLPTSRPYIGTLDINIRTTLKVVHISL